MCCSLSYKQIWPWHTPCPHALWRHFKWACFVPYRRHLKKKTGGGRDRTPREGQALRWRSSSQDVTGCWLEDAQEGLGRPTKTALQLQGVVFQAPASPLAATQRVLACTGPRPGRQGSKARSFIYSGCCWGLGISCLGEVGKKTSPSFSFHMRSPEEDHSFISSCSHTCFGRCACMCVQCVHGGLHKNMLLTSALGLLWVFVYVCVSIFAAFEGPLYGIILV